LVANSASLRHGLVELLFGEGVLTSPAVADAFLEVPRERFLPQVAIEEGLAAVYRNDAIVTRRDERGTPLSSSSQPSIMAAMLEALALEPGHRVLEVGTGTGYNAALLSELVGPAGRVTSVELDPELATRAAAALAEGSHRVHVVVGDGRDGWPAGAPYDRMIVTASAPGVPRPWFDQLAEDGLVVMPLWLRQSLQTVVVLRRRPEGFVSVALIPGGFMRMRESLGETEPVLQDQLSAHDHVGSEPGRPVVSLAGAALRSLDRHRRRRLLAQALGPSRTVPLARPAAGDDLLLFVSLAADEDHLIEWFGERAGEAGPGVVGAGGSSLAVLRRAPVVDHLDAWGGTEAEDALLGLVERWEVLGRPGRERLRVHVNYGAAPQAGRPASRTGGAVSFDWA
jgi:protein-L-isoaspartate(D-aspartate) O-methyltransferase